MIGITLSLVLGLTGWNEPVAAAPRTLSKYPAATPREPHFIPVDQQPFFDLPVTYNGKVKKWIRFFQSSGRNDFKKWLERSHRYLPPIRQALQKRGLPLDLAYLAMIESGFSGRAVSSADAVGYWQFIKGTANRYGLKTDWWIDERRDYYKSTLAAASYLADLHEQFRSWYLAMSAYNMGENRLRRLISKHGTQNFWVLSRKSDFPAETRDYIPKLIAAILIAKAPGLYGFHDVVPSPAFSYEYFFVPGGTDIKNLARFTGVSEKTLNQLNPELIRGFVPPHVKQHAIRIPRGSEKLVAKFVRESFIE